MALIPAAHIRSSVTVTNNTNGVLPIGAGVKLQAQQTRTFNVSSVQLQEELVPRLEKLHLAGKVNYSLTPGTPQDVGAAGGLGLAAAGQQSTLPAVSIPSPAALAQTAWYINPLTGSDNNTGASATQGSGLVGPIKTFAEYIRRTGVGRPISHPVDIYIGSDLPLTDPVILSGTYTNASAYIYLHGTNLVPLATGTLTGYTAPVATTNTLPQVTDALMTNWTPYAGKLLRMTSGAHSTDGGAMWIIKDLGSHKARVSNPTYYYDPYNAFNFVPAGTETYEIVSPRLLGGGLCIQVKSIISTAANVRLDYVATPTLGVGISGTDYGACISYGCDFSGGLEMLSTNHSMYNCQLGNFTLIMNSYVGMMGGYINNATLQIDNSNLTMTETPVAIRAGSLYYYGTRSLIRADVAGLFGSVGAVQMSEPTNYWNLQNYASLIVLGDIYGDVATGAMYLVGAGCKMSVGSPALLRVGGATNDIKVAGKTAIFPIVAATGLPAGAVQTCSLANFANAGIFNGNIVDPFTGTSVLTVA